MTERDVQDAAAERDRLAERLALLGLEIERGSGEADRARSQWANDTWEIAQRERRKAEMEQETAAILGAIGQLKTARESSQAHGSELRGKLAGLEERQRSASSALARLEQSIEELVRRAADLEGQCQQWAQQQVEWEDEKQRLEQQVIAAEQRSEELAKRVADLEISSTEGRQRFKVQEQELHQLRAALEETREKKSAVEVQLALLQSEIEHLKETCRNELQLELEDLAAGEDAASQKALGLERLS